MRADRPVPPRTTDPAELARRARDYGDACLAAASSTAPADRPRAEAALRALYRNADLAEPRVVWVKSPVAGVFVAAAVAAGTSFVLGRHQRGAIGTGAGRDRANLANPFDLRETWHRRLLARVHDRLGSAGLLADAIRWPDPMRDSRLALRLNDRMEGAVHHAIAAGDEAGGDEPEDVTQPVAFDLGDDRYDGLAASLLGSTWTDLVERADIGTAREAFVHAARRAAASITSDTRRISMARTAMQPGQFDTEARTLAAIRDVFGERLRHPAADPERNEVLVDARLELAESAGPWWALDGVAILSERPLAIHLDDRGRLHHPSLPAIAWADGTGVWAWHGVFVDPWIIEDPERISVADIDRTANTEVRRVLIERFGEERLIREGGAELVHEDDAGRLWRRAIEAPTRWSSSADEPLVMVEVRNSTLEPDGTRKTYFLRVPPTTQTAREAVAWTFGLSFDTYRPAVET